MVVHTSQLQMVAPVLLLVFLKHHPIHHLVYLLMAFQMNLSQRHDHQVVRQVLLVYHNHQLICHLVSLRLVFRLGHLLVFRK